MAEEEMNNNREDDNNGNDENENSSNGNGDSSLTDDCLMDYKEKVLKKEVDAAASAENVSQTTYERKQTVKNYKTCSIIQAQAASDEYVNIANCITTLLGQSTLEIQSNIEGYIAMGEEVETTLLEAVQAVKNAKAKLTAVNDAACKLENAMKDSCNSEQLTQLGRGFSTLIEKGKTDKSFSAHIEEIQKQVDTANDTGLVAFETGIKVAGVQQFTNLESMKSFGDKLQEGVSLLTGDVTENIEFNSGKEKKVQEELTTTIQEFTTAKYQMFMAQLRHKSLNSTSGYVDNPYGPADEEGEEVSLQAICEKVESSFGKCVDEE